MFEPLLGPEQGLFAECWNMLQFCSLGVVGSWLQK